MRRLKQILNRSICLWLVSNENGRVHKLRFKLSIVAAVVLAILLGLGITVAVFGDYARIQFAKAQSYIEYLRLVSERNDLRDQKEKLENQVAELKLQTEQAAAYEIEVKARLGELRGILGAAAAGGVPPDQKVATTQKNAAAAKNIGGAEIPCRAAEGSECLPAQNPALSEGKAALSIGKLSKMGYVAPYAGNENARAELDEFLVLARSMPLGSPVPGDITSNFGMRNSPFFAGLTMHEGMDFSLGESDLVRVTGDGIVEKVLADSTYGLRVDIRHGDNIRTRYGHLSRAVVVEGQLVERGDVLAIGGSTGRSTGPHLHYEVQVANEAINPAPFLTLPSKLAELLKS